MRGAIRTLILFALLAACAPQEGDRAHEELEKAEGRHDHDEPGHSEAEAETEANAGAGRVVEIEAEMLRDLRITTTPVVAQSVGQGQAMLGELKVDERRYAEVAPAIAGIAVRVLAAVGDRVEKGQTLAELESVELGRAGAERLAAAARLGAARQSLDRRRALARERIVPKRQVEEAESEVSVAAAALRGAETALRALGADSKEDRKQAPNGFALRAAVAGEVLERGIVLGRMIPAGEVVYRIADLETVWLVVQAFERDAVRVSPGTTARVSLAALPGRAFLGTVSLVGRQVNVESRTVPVRIEVENPDGLLWPGMSATALVPLGEAEAQVTTVPSAALQRVGEDWVAFVPRSESAFEVRVVGRGRDLGEQVEVLSGLTPGEEVVVSGSFLLKAESEKVAGGGEAHHHH